MDNIVIVSEDRIAAEIRELKKQGHNALMQGKHALAKRLLNDAYQMECYDDGRMVYRICDIKG